MERLKQKVASSSSRVIASLQQAATGNFQQQQQAAGAASGCESNTSAGCSTTNQLQPAVALSSEPTATKLMATDATAHLTKAEREILLEVFKKEEQFQRDTIKQMSASRALQTRSNEFQPEEDLSQQLTDKQSHHVRQQRINQQQSARYGQETGSRQANAATCSAASEQPPRSITRAQQQQHSVANSSLSSQISSSPNSSFASARSTTPMSRPSSTSGVFGTPFGNPRQRPGSVGSSSAGSAAHQQLQSGANLVDISHGQCRICRKLIQANETCHLCSNCNQFICDDCASYSAADQHWMCSSCRRRTTKPAIPADALKELGLNQNSSAVRRMTLRLNQNELKLALAKGSSESAGSSNSSSGCSSMSAAAKPARDGQCNLSSRPRRTSVQLQQQRLIANKQPVDRAKRGSFCGAGEPMSHERAKSQKTLSQPVQQAKRPDDKLSEGGSAATPAAAAALRQLAGSQVTFVARMRDVELAAAGRRMSQQQPAAAAAAALAAQPARRSSVAISDEQQQQHQQHQQRHQQRLAQLQRKQSTAGQSVFDQVELQGDFYNGQQQYVQPKTMITASSETSMDNNANLLARQQQQQQQTRRDSSAQQYHHPPGTTLIPIPPDQIHLRRLSDQTNLVRRSSIIADTIDSTMLARNRSHSNIDSVGYPNYFYQSALFSNEPPLDLFDGHQNQSAYNYSTESLHHSQQLPFQPHQHQQLLQVSSGWSSQQRRPSDQWVQQQHVAAQQQSLAAAAAAAAAAGSQMQPQPQQRISSIITSYSHKNRRSSDEIRSDSSSDIDEDEARNNQANFDLENEQPNEYFAPPRALSSSLQAEFMRSQQEMAANQISIPSVSISEFSSSQQRLHQQMQQQLHQRQPFDQIMTTPMQINMAIEQAIQTQQQRQSRRFGSMQANELLPGQLGSSARRGSSSGRVLPRIPGEQSRSLLDLPTNHSEATKGAGAGLSQNGQHGSTGDQQFAKLDLPCVSPTIRRASAPEGQNIKIVVDDIDGSILGVGGLTGSLAGKTGRRQVYGKQGELYERLVLYRDDSLDPNTNMARGFGLQVTGGKIEQDDKLQACVTWVLIGGPADKVGLKAGDKIIEWDGKSLVNLSYEQVAEVIESSANIAELVVKPSQKVDIEPGAAVVNYVRSQRRMSQQTERDLKRIHQQPGCQFDTATNQNNVRLQLRTNSTARVTSSSTNTNTTTTAINNDFSQLNVSSRAQQQAASAGNSPSRYARAGTGRRLPQIPLAGCMATADGLLSGGQPSELMGYKHASTGQLEPSGVGLAGNGVGPGGGSANHLSAQHEQQSRSAGELYTGSAYQIMAQSQTQLTGAGQFWPQQPNYNSAYQQPIGRHHPISNQLSVAQDEIVGLIGLQVNVDERAAQLEISVLNAINMNFNTSYDYYVRIRILPESNRLKPCTTQPSSDMQWKETFIFQNFPTQQIHKMALEIGIWVYDEAPRLTTQIAQPICETLIPIQSARERNTDFWPLRPPPTSPQARRKSLNDLIETHTKLENRAAEALLSAGYLQSASSANWNSNPMDNSSLHNHLSSSAHKVAGQELKYPAGELFGRGRSSSNRNLPDGGKSPIQPRRASDEVAGSSSHKLSLRVSPAASRRSISVMNVGDGPSLFSRPSSRLGSQANIVKIYTARNANNQQQQPTGGNPQLQQQLHSTANGSPVNRFSTPKAALSQTSSTNVPETTPSGRRSSLIGIQSMAGYRSQKNSQSDATDQDSPLRVLAKPKRAQPSTPPLPAIGDLGSVSNDSTGRPRTLQHRASVISTTGTPASGSGSGSRRGSSEHHPPPLERKRSFAMLTLHRLKRTMSLTKGSDQEQPGSNVGSRKSSSSSNNSLTDQREDVGVTRRIAGHKDFVGKIKLSFIMTMGQFEVEVNCAQGLRYDHDSSLGVYVKMYLKGKSRGGKRKTRVVQPWESPIFKQTIKYDGSLVDNKSLEVSVWQKQSGLKGKIPIGFTEIRLSELNLTQLQTGWYNLRSMDLMGGSSLDD